MRLTNSTKDSETIRKAIVAVSSMRTLRRRACLLAPLAGIRVCAF